MFFDFEVYWGIKVIVCIFVGKGIFFFFFFGMYFLLLFFFFGLFLFIIVDVVEL